MEGALATGSLACLLLLAEVFERSEERMERSPSFGSMGPLILAASASESILEAVREPVQSNVPRTCSCASTINSRPHRGRLRCRLRAREQAP